MNSQFVLMQSKLNWDTDTYGDENDDSTNKLVKIKGGMNGGDSQRRKRENEKWNTSQEMNVGRRVVFQF